MTDTPKRLSATRLTLSYSSVEDRFVLWLGAEDGETATLVLTRRLTGMLINGIAAVLARSSPEANRAPQEMRDDIVTMEHHGVLTQGGAADGPASQPPAPIVAPMLVDTVNITTLPTHFLLVFKTPDHRSVETVMGRADLHRVVEMLRRRAEEVSWALPLDSGWLTNEVTVN